MMKIPDLSKIDIKDIDVNKLKDQLLERKDLLVQIGLVLVSLLIILSLFNKSQAEIRKMKSQSALLQSKTSAIAEYDKARDDVNTFLKIVSPPLWEDQIIGFVTDQADKNKVRILTFSPAKIEDKGLLSTTTMQFSLETREYKDMVRFIADIEHSKSLLQVKMCTSQAQAGTEDAAKGQESPLISFRIDVSAIQVKL